MSAVFTPKYIGFLVLVGLLVAGAELAVIENRLSSVTDDEIYDTSTEHMAGSFSGFDIYTGRARLAAEVGIMTLSLEELQYMFDHNFRYIHDIYDYQSWKLPSVFIKEGGGDCEDYLMFALATLDREKYDMKPIVGTFGSGADNGHAFTLVREKSSGEVFLVDNSGVRDLPADAWNSLSLPSPYSADKVYDSMLRSPFLGVF